MKIAYMSDLHLNYKHLSENIEFIDKPDVILIAGDISPNIRDHLYLFEKCLPRNIPKVLILGNHDYEGLRLENANLMYSRLYSILENTHLLIDSSVVIDGVKFIGSTLWSDFSLAGSEEAAKVEMNWAKNNVLDFNDIFKGDGNFISPSDMREMSSESQKLIHLYLKEPFEGKRVVMTHFAPHPLSIHPKYSGMMNAYWANNLEHLLGFSDIWIHGHVHSSFDYVVEGTRVVCNPRGNCGNVPENPDFDLYKMIEI